MSNAQAIASLAKFSAGLRSLPTIVAIKVAEAAAPILTGLVHATFEASENAYGTSWVPGADGQTVKLRKSGNLAKNVAYTAVGTKIRLRLGTSYAKYQVGRRPIAPPQGGALPVAYAKALSDVAAQVIRAELGTP